MPAPLQFGKFIIVAVGISEVYNQEAISRQLSAISPRAANPVFADC
jgi:hypothetical protein